MIDLFKLHNNIEDKGAYSWIVVDGPGLFTNFKFLIKKITEKSSCSIKSLSKKISDRIGCSDSMLYDILNRKTKWIPLNLINELLSVLEELGEGKEATRLRNKFLASIRFLKSTPRSVVKIKAVKKLSLELAELCGIHAADGSLNLGISIESKHKKDITEIKNKLNKGFPNLKISEWKRKDKHIICFYITQLTQAEILNYLNSQNINFSVFYKIEFVDFDRSSLQYLRKLILKLFGYQVKIRSIKEGNGYYVHFSNKIIGRYLKNILNFPIGKKSSIVDVPKLIKNAPFPIRKAFARGLIQFDGSVKRNGSVALSTNSRHLMNFFLNTIKNDDLKGVVWARRDRKEELTFESPPSKKWLTYFIEGTPKYQRLYEYIYGFKGKVKSVDKIIKIFDRAFSNNNRSTLSFGKLIRTALKLKKFTRYQISNKLGIHYKSLSVMLDILENAKMIKVERVKMLDRFKKKSDKITFNNNIEAWRIPLLPNSEPKGDFWAGGDK